MSPLCFPLLLPKMHFHQEFVLGKLIIVADDFQIFKKKIYNLIQMNCISVLIRSQEYSFIDSTPMQIKIHIKYLENKQNLSLVFQLHFTLLSPWTETNRTVLKTLQSSLETINLSYKVIRIRTKSIRLSFWAHFRYG